MADIRLAKPAAGATESVQCAPDARFVFDFPTTDATLARDGDNLNIRFEDGSNLELQGFYQQYNEENLPSFNIDGTEVAAADFFQAMNEPDLMPAAGPGTGTVANGARFHEWGDSALTGGIQHLNGLDWGFARNFEWDDVPNAVGRNGDDWGWWGGSPDNPVTLTPEDPTPVPPGTPNIPGVPDGGEPGNQGIVPPGDVRLVSEAGLRNGDSVSVNGAMRVGAPDGLASIEIGGRVIWQNGHMVGNPEFATDEGYFHNFAYDAASGRLTYTYTLTDATTEHKLPGADYIAHSLPLTVRDVDGDSASSHITIIIQDDVAASLADTNTLTEDGETYVTGNLLANDTAGADGWMAGSLTLTDADGNAQGATVEGTYGTLTIQPDGNYTYTLKDEYRGEDGKAKLPHDVQDELFHYQVKDADGDVTNNTLTIDLVNKPLVPTGPQNPSDSKEIEATSVEFTLKDADAAGAAEATQTQTADLFNGPQAVTGVVFAAEQNITVNGAANNNFTWTGAGTNTLVGTNADGVTVTVTIEGFKDDGTVSMKAVMNDPAGHAADSDSISITGIAVTGTDAGGSSATNNNVSITIVDAEPDSVKDEETITETDDPHASVSGNVLENDKEGADGWMPGSVELTDAGATKVTDADGHEFMQMDGKYGTLTIDSDGHYTYTLKDGVPEKPENEVFNYQVKDADGDITSTTLTINLVNKPLEPTEPTPGNPDDTGLKATSIEFTLKDMDAEGKAEATQEKSADLFDGPQTVTAVVFGSTEDIQVNGAAGEFNWSVSDDGKTLTGVNGTGDDKVTVTVTIEGFKDDGTVSMKAVMNDPAGHAADSDSISITGIAVTGTDAGGSSATNKNVSITIVDAKPDSVKDEETITETDDPHASVSGNVLENDKEGADGWMPGSVELTDAGATKVTDADGHEFMQMDGKYGTLTIDSDGHYTYTLKDGVPEKPENEVFNYQVKDADGDITSTTLTINLVNKPLEPTEPTPGNPDDTGLKATSIEFTLKDVDAEGKAEATQEKAADLFDGPQAVTDVVFAAEQAITVEGAAGKFDWSVSEDGKTLTGVNGDVTVTVTIEGFKDDGTVSMKAVMNDPAGHAVDSDSIKITGIAVTGTDAGGSSATNDNVSITIKDDATVWKAGSDVVTSGETLTSLNGSYNTHIKFTVDSEHVGATKADFASIDLTQSLTTNTYAKKVPWEGAPGGEKEFFWAGSGGPADETYVAETKGGDITITPTFVHYKYVTDTEGQVQVDHMVDITNSIPRSAKALYLTEEGLTVGANKSANVQQGAYHWGTGAWNGTTPGEISVGSGTQTNGGEEGLLNMPSGSGSGGVVNFESAYGDGHYLGKNHGIDSDNVSEAIAFDTHNGLISYGFNIGLGMDGGDRVLLTFVMTPAHSSDDSIVKMVEITQGMDLAKIYNGAVTLNSDGTYTISVPDGFTKVFVSALPKQDYTVGDGGFSATQTTTEKETSGFTIKEVDFLAATYTTEGKVTASSADGIESYDWNFENIPTDGSKAVFVKGVGGDNYAVQTSDDTPKTGYDEDGNLLKTYTFKLSGGELNGQTLFTATINTTTGEWSVTHFREFDMLNGKNPFQIDGTDTDGDTATLPLHITPQFTRFSNVIDGYYDPKWQDQNVVNKDYADDILVGNDNNTLIYGKGGDDLLIGDSYDTTKPIDSTNTQVDKALEIILGATKTETNLNHVKSTGGETGEPSKVDTLYGILSNKDLNNEAKVLLGKELEAREKGTHGNDALYGGRGNDLLFGGGGDDYLSGDLGKDIIYAGKGNDIILYDKEDLYIDGGDGKDILVGGKDTPSLAELRSRENAENGPVVKNVEMLLTSKSDFTSSLEISSHKSLADNYGISITDAGVTLSADWTLNTSLSTDDIKVYENANNGNKLTLEVYRTVTVMQPTADTSSMARAAGIAGEVGLLTALAAANGVEAAPVREDDADAAAQEAQAADSGLDAAAVSYAEAETSAPAGAQPGAEPQDGFETLIADLGEVTPAMLDGAAEVRDTRYTAFDGENEAQTVDRASAAGDTHRAAGEGASSGGQGHGANLPDGVEVIREGDGDDFIDAGEGSHAIYAGAGDDLIVYDATDYLIDGGDGIDFLLSGSADPAHSLADMLGNWEHKGADTDMPMVHDVEVMLKGVDTSLQNMDSLAARYGFSMDKDANGRDILVLDKGKWELDESQSGNGTNTYVNAESGITLETTLAEVGTGTDAGEQAAQTIVLANNG